MRELFSLVEARLFVKFIEVAMGKRRLRKPAGGISAEDEMRSQRRLKKTVPPAG